MVATFFSDRHVSAACKEEKNCKHTQLVARMELVLISRADLPRCSLDTCAENQKMQIWEEDPALDYSR